MLEADNRLLGNDQRKLFTAAKEWLPRIGYKQRAHLLSPMVPGLQGGKMVGVTLLLKIACDY